MCKLVNDHLNSKLSKIIVARFRLHTSSDVVWAWIMLQIILQHYETCPSIVTLTKILLMRFWETDLCGHCPNLIVDHFWYCVDYHPIIKFVQSDPECIFHQVGNKVHLCIKMCDFQLQWYSMQKLGLVTIWHAKAYFMFDMPMHTSCLFTSYIIDQSSWLCEKSDLDLFVDLYFSITSRPYILDER